MMIAKSKTGFNRRLRKGAALGGSDGAAPEADAALRRARRASALTTLALFFAIAAAAVAWMTLTTPTALGAFVALAAIVVGGAVCLWIHDAREATIDALFGVRER